jgi:hypothetical protein
MSISVSVLTLMAISIERYQAIVYPLKFSGTKQRARILIFSIWILSILLVLPGYIMILFFYSDKEKRNIQSKFYDL